MSEEQDVKPIIERLLNDLRKANRTLKIAALKGDKWLIHQSSALIEQKANEIAVFIGVG